jgi:phosphate transport system substrate-binding protein
MLRRKTMKKVSWLALALVVLMALAGLAEAAVTLNGAGATFPYPIYAQWAHKYNSLTGLKVNYQAIGSGGGIAQIKAKTVDFGASDAPLKPDALKAAGLVQFPRVIGGVVLVVNVSGVGPGQLKLDGKTLADIFLGKVKKWNDPAIKGLNPGLKLPSQAITVAHRTDGSGTTFIYTSYLSAVSPDWKAKVGAGKAVSWPAANSVGGKGNAGVAGQVKNISGAIGYVEYAYALQNKMAYIQLKNKAGNFINPSIATFQAAAANADWAHAPGYYLILVDQPGGQSWPIVGATYILVHKDQTDTAKIEAMLKYFKWCYEHGGKMAEKLDYVPLPANVVQMVEKTWSTEIKVNGKPPKF